MLSSRLVLSVKMDLLEEVQLEVSQMIQLFLLQFRKNLLVILLMEVDSCQVLVKIHKILVKIKRKITFI
jgi:hypothetical protein